MTTKWALPNFYVGAAAAAKSLQSYLTLCDPRDGSHQAPPSLGFSNLQAINAGEGVEKRAPSYTVGMQTSTATMENSVEIPLKIANRTAL